MPGPATRAAQAAGRGVLAGRAGRRAAEVIRQLPAEAHFAAGIEMGRHVAQRPAPMRNRVPAPTIGVDRSVARPAAHALVHEVDQRLVVQLVVPALEFLVAQRVVDGVLRFLRERPRANHADLQLRGTQVRVVTRVVAEAGEQDARVRAVVRNHVAAGVVGRGKDRLADREHHVLLIELARMQAFQIAVDPARSARQTRVVGVVDQIRRNQRQQRAVGIALVLVFATEQVVVDPEIHRRRRTTQSAGIALVGRQRGQRQAGEGKQQGSGQRARSEHGGPGARGTGCGKGACGHCCAA